MKKYKKEYTTVFRTDKKTKDLLIELCIKNNKSISEYLRDKIVYDIEYDKYDCLRKDVYSQIDSIKTRMNEIVAILNIHAEKLQ